MNDELPCDTEIVFEDYPEIQGDELPKEVRDAAAKLFEIFHKGEELVVYQEPKIPVRGIVRQPPLPQIFQLIIANDNARKAIRDLGSAMTQADWRRLKELTRYKRKSLIPGAQKATSYAGE